MRLLALACFVLLFSSLVYAVTSEDARVFLRPDESLAEEKKLSLDGKGVTMFRGPAGSIVLFHDDTGLVLTREESLRALEQITLEMTAEQAKEFSSLATEFREGVKLCAAAYAEFASGKDAEGKEWNCYETSYYRYQCRFLWDQGLWKGITSFSLVDARKTIEASLPKMSEAATALASVGASFEKSDFSQAFKATSAIESAKAASEAFSEWHAKMVSYPSFARDGRLQQCSLKTSSLERLAEMVGYSLDAGTQKGSESLGKQLDVTTARGIGRHYRTLSVSKLEDFSEKAAAFSKEFSSVRGARAVFTGLDEQALRQAAENVGGESEAKARTSMNEFNEALQLAGSKLERMRTLLPQYREAALLLKGVNELAVQAAAKSGGEAAAQRISRKAFDSEAVFIPFEQEMRLRANVTAEDAAQVKKTMTEAQQEISLIAGENPLIGYVVGISPVEAGGFALLFLVAAALAYHYYKMKHY